MLVAMELLVVDARSPVYARFLAGYVLVKVWARLRSDGCRGTTPRRIEGHGDHYDFHIARSKTSGCSRTGQHAYLAKDAGFTSPGRMEAFTQILADPCVAIARDYLAPFPAPGLNGAISRMAEYDDCSASRRAMRSWRGR